MSTVLLWLRNDLHLHDQSVLHAACQLGAQHLLPAVCLPDVQATTPWGFARISPHRRAWLANTIQNLLQGLSSKRSRLLILNQPAATTPCLPWRGPWVPATIVCEDIAAPEEQAEVAALRAAGLQVYTVWHSSLLHPQHLPWPVQRLPAVFTPFCQQIEQAGLQPRRAPATARHAAPSATVCAQRLVGRFTQTLAALAGTATRCRCTQRLPLPARRAARR